MVDETLIYARNDEDRQVQQAEVLKAGLARHFTAGDAENLSNFSRYYVTPSPELAASIAQAGIDWDHPMLQDINWRDAEEQQRPWWDLLHQGSRAMRPVRAGVRGLAATAEAVWEEGLPRLTRTAIQAYQNPGQSLVTSWRDAGASDLAYGIGERLQGNPVNWGTGWFPQSNPAWEQPGFGTELQGRMQTDIDAGIDPRMTYQANFDSVVSDYESRYGRDIVYDGQRIRENTIISKTRGGETYSSPFSFGRGAAIQVANPGSTAFNFISAGIDGYLRIAGDPINVPANELRRINQVRDLIIPANASEAGLVTYRRPWVNPKTAEDWLTSGRGQRRIQYLADTTDVSDVRAVVPGMDLGDQLSVVAASRPEEVINILRPYLGTTQMPKAPVVSRTRLLGNRIRNSNGTVSHMLPDRNSIMGHWYHRQTASSGATVINVYDVDRSVDGMLDALDTIEATSAQKNLLATRMLKAANDPIAMNRVVGEFKEVLEQRLVTLGYDEVQVRQIMDDFTKLQDANREYLINLAGDAIEMQGSGNYAITTPDGDTHLLRLTHAADDAEIAQQLVVLPNMRNLRLASSRVRAFWDSNSHVMGRFKTRMGWDPRGGSVGTAVRALDYGQSVWRNFALIRGGWMIRIVGEEAIRRQAAGYGMFLEHPMEALALVWDSNMRGIGSYVDGALDNLDDYFEAQSLGASGFRVDREMNPMMGTRFDGARSNFTVQPATRRYFDKELGEEVIELTEAGRRGLAWELQSANRSVLRTHIEELGVDDAVAYLQSDEGVEYLQQLRRDTANQANPMGRFVDRNGVVDEVLLRQTLEYLELDNARLAGGKGIYRDPDSDIWLDHFGNPIRDPRRMTDAELRKWLGEPDYARLRRSPTTGHYRSLHGDEALAELYEIMGLPDLNALEAAHTWAHVLDPGSEAVHNLIKTGDSLGGTVVRKPPVSIVRESLEGRLASTNLKQGTIRIDAEAIAADYADDIAHMRGLDGTTAGLVQAEALEELGVDIDDLKRWLDENGGSVVYQRFIEEHERAHAALHAGMDYPGVTTLEALDMEMQANKLALEEIGYLDRPSLPRRHENLYFHGTSLEAGAEIQHHGMVSGGFTDDAERALNYATSEDDVVLVFDKKATGLKGSDQEQVVSPSATEAEVAAILEDVPGYASIPENLKPKEALSPAEFRAKYVDRPRIQISPDQTIRDQYAFELRVHELYDGGYVPPGHVRMPSQTQRARNKSFSSTVSDFAFEWLGEKPTMNLIRSPFAKVRYTEEMARAYLWSDDATRAVIKNWARDNGVSGIFDKFVTRHMSDHGLKALPTGIDDAFADFDFLDEVVRRKVVEDTKDLFYDLSRKQNWADAMRLVFPFADAWQEVLSRWIKAMSGTGMGGPGQAVRNWERLRQGLQGMSTSSFFGEDQFGNEVFNVPAMGLAFPGLNSQTQWTVRPEQMMFIDPTLRGVAGPGTGPMVQVAAALVKPAVKKFMGQEAADTMDSFLFGEYVSPRLGVVGDLTKVFMPSWMKRSVEQIFADENELAYADEIVQIFSSLLHSQDPRYVPYDQASIKSTMEQARGIGTQLGIARIVDAMILPALPRYEPGVFVDIADHPDGGFWMTMASLGAEYRRAEDLFGDQDAAIQYILSTFGLNPLNTVSKTYSLRQYPTTQAGLQYIQDSPEIKQHFNNTMMMFIPEGDNTEWYYPAWDEGQRAGARAVTTPEMAEQMVSRQNGRGDWNQRMLEYDKALEEAANKYGTDSETYRQYRDELRDWLNRERYRIDAMYWSWDSAVAGQKTRPTYQDLYDELKLAGTPGTEANRLGNDLNPELTEFLTFATDLWTMLEEESLNRQFGHDWWRTSTAQSPQRAEEVYLLRQWFSDGISQYIDGMEGQAKLGAEWATEYVFTRLMEGAEWDEEVFIAVDEPEPPLPKDMSEETYVNEILSPVGLEQ